MDYSCHASGALDTISDNGAGGDPIAEYDYIGGRTLRRKMRNGVNLDLRDGSGTRYDNAGLPTRWAHLDTNEQGSPVLIGFEYAYDHGGNKLYQRSLHDPLDSQRYAYDSAERLAAYSRGWFGEGDCTPSSPEYCDAATSSPWSGMTQAQKWLLDGVGNWDVINTTANDALTSETRKDTSFNEYYDIGGAAQSHDDNGNLTDDGNQQYAWDLFNRLREVRNSSDTLIVSYLYDSGNRRVRKDLAGGTDLEYFYTGWQVLEERTTAGALEHQFVDGNYIDEHLVMDVNEDADSSCIGAADSRYFYHQNALYSVYALTDDTGELIEAYEYDPYGNHVLLTDGNDGDSIVNFNANDVRTTAGMSYVGNSYAFTGRRSDSEVAAYCYRSRLYATGRGRFLSQDPVAARGAPNPYLYCGGNPILFLDPYGLKEYAIQILPFIKFPDDMIGVVYDEFDRLIAALIYQESHVLATWKKPNYHHVGSNKHPWATGHIEKVDGEEHYYGMCAALADFLLVDLGRILAETNREMNKGPKAVPVLIKPRRIYKWAGVPWPEESDLKPRRWRFDHWSVVLVRPRAITIETSCDSGGVEDVLYPNTKVDFSVSKSWAVHFSVADPTVRRNMTVEEWLDEEGFFRALGCHLADQAGCGGWLIED